jgi:hypothetical protein
MDMINWRSLEDWQKSKTDRMSDDLLMAVNERNVIISFPIRPLKSVQSTR